MTHLAARYLQPRMADRPRTLLLVEDEPALLRLTVMVLEEEGYTVLAAADGREAVAVAERHQGPIHLLLTDVSLPQMSGPQLAAALQARRPELEVLYVSGYSDSQLLSRGVREDEVHFLPKPYVPDQLLARVDGLTGGPSGRRE